MTIPPPLPLTGAAAVKRPVSSAVLAGWICIGIGVCTFWIFGLGFYLIGLGAVCGIVAMCTHQVKAGLVLLFGSIAAAGLCVVLMLVVVAGFLGVVGIAAQKAQGAAEAEAKANPIPKGLPVDSAFDLESQFRRKHKELSGQIENSLRPVIQQLEPPATPPEIKPRPPAEPKPDAATLRRQKELQELRERQGN